MSIACSVHDSAASFVCLEMMDCEAYLYSSVFSVSVVFHYPAAAVDEDSPSVHLAKEYNFIKL